MSLPEWFDVAQTAYWILGILSGGAFLGCMARVLVLSLHEEESRIGDAEMSDRPQHAGNVVPIDGWRESKVIVSRSDLHRGFGG
jgi:hypothetical protein